jgi:hypothetical protein
MNSLEERGSLTKSQKRNTRRTAKRAESHDHKTKFEKVLELDTIAHDEKMSSDARWESSTKLYELEQFAYKWEPKSLLKDQSKLKIVHDFQTRSDTFGCFTFTEWERVVWAVVHDPTVWKISYTTIADNQSHRWIRCRNTWDDKPLVINPETGEITCPVINKIKHTELHKLF